MQSLNHDHQLNGPLMSGRQLRCPEDVTSLVSLQYDFHTTNMCVENESCMGGGVCKKSQICMGVNESCVGGNKFENCNDNDDVTSSGHLSCLPDIKGPLNCGHGSMTPYILKSGSFNTS
jgi:hypothetical protein